VPQRIEAELSTSLAGLLHVAQQDKRTVLVSDGAGMLRPIPSDGARYALDGAEPDPALVAAVTAWCATADRLIVELRAGGGSLEDVYLELVGRTERPTDPETEPSNGGVA
jgi:hypothetical protein